MIMVTTAMPNAAALRCHRQLPRAWWLRERGASSVIVGATHPEQLEENCKASGVTLPQEVIDRIDAMFAAHDT